MSALLFGSIGTIADTSELQRKAFNDAFAAHGLDWRWDRDDYVAMLEASGGRNRIAEYARSLGQTVDAQAIHRSKSELFRKSLAQADLRPRAGVVETIRAAKDGGLKVALVTTTSPANITSLIDALPASISASDFDLIVDDSSVEQPKPDRAAYAFALASMAEEPGGCVAIEDNVGGVDAATAAGVTCVAFPGENNAGHDFGKARVVVDHLDFAELQKFVPST